MKSFLAFLKKELLENVRSGRLLLLGILFGMFGIMNPAVAKLTPWMLEMLSDSLAESGMTVNHISVDALTSWTQFFKNIPVMLISLAVLYSGTLTGEWEKGTLILLLTKGFARYKVVLAKFAVIAAVWTAGYWLCFAITYGYNAYFWDNGIAPGLPGAVTYWWLSGIWIVCLLILFSALCKSSAGVLLGTGGTVLAVYVLGLFPEIGEWMPTALMRGAALLTDAGSGTRYMKAVVLTVVLCIACVLAGTGIMNKREM